ncbi:MAG: ABC-2 family transporter protein [Caldilineaceae bacterium]
MMVYYADLYLTYLRNLVRLMGQYRADFLIMLTASLIHDGSTLLLLTIIFTNIRQLQGWSFHEMLLIYGLSVTTRSLWNTFLDVPHRIQWYVRGGLLDTVLVRPPALLFQIAAEHGINPPAFGRVLVGLAAIVIALTNLPVTVAWWWFLYLPLVIVSGVLIQFSVGMILASLSFWFTNVQSLLTTTFWLTGFGQYPVHIFAWPLQFLLTWIFPVAMMGFFPAAFLLRGDEYRFWGLLAPFMGFFFLAVALSVWRVALRHYQSTGS